MLDAMDDHDVLIFDDPVDDTKVATTSRVQSLQFTKQWFARSLRVPCNWPKCRFYRCESDFLRKVVEVPSSFRCDLDGVHRILLDVIL